MFVAFACQSIAEIEDVKFTATASAADCERYCDTVAEGCPGDLAVYEDRDTCLAVCATFPISKQATGNSLACRLGQANSAVEALSTERGSNCTEAGPGGGRVCTTHEESPDCQGYCSLYMAACESISKEWHFLNLDECIDKCAVIPGGGRYSAGSAAESGDTLACRIFQASAATLDPAAHCSSAGLFAAGDCLGEGDPSCDDYCSVVDLACTGKQQVFESEEQCKAVCARTPLGSRTDTGGDSVGCKLYHSYNAAFLDPAVHCPHAGPAGDGVCSPAEDPNCAPYCRLAQDACSARFTADYEDEAGCLEQCRALSDDEAHENLYSVAAAQSGDTLKCRLLNATRALEVPDEADEFCPAALGGTPGAGCEAPPDLLTRASLASPTWDFRCVAACC